MCKFWHKKICTLNADFSICRFFTLSVSAVLFNVSKEHVLILYYTCV